LATAFITAAELSDFLGRDVSADDGAEAAIEAACQICRDVAGQDLTEATETILLDGTGTDCLVLPGFPTSSVTTVTVGGTADTDFVLGNGMLFKQAGTWTKGRRNISVKYKHGYRTRDVPASVKQVAKAVAARLLVQAPKNAMAEVNGDVSIRYATAPTDLTANELRILRKHAGR
jgi:hypothetical protein